MFDQIMYIMNPNSEKYVTIATSDSIVELLGVGYEVGKENECNMIIPHFVRPIHYSIFEDE